MPLAAKIIVWVWILGNITCGAALGVSIYLKKWKLVVYLVSFFIISGIASAITIHYHNMVFLDYVYWKLGWLDLQSIRNYNSR